MSKKSKFPISPYNISDLKVLKRRTHSINGVADKVVRVEWFRQELLVLGRQYFYSWRQNYSINVPNYNLFTASTPDGLVTHVVIDRIYGMPLKRGVKLPQRCYRELDELLVNLFRATLNAYRRQRPLCTDMALDQFMYGHKHGQRTKKFYLVDIDPWFVFYSPQKKKRYDHCFWVAVCEQFPAEIRRAERWLGGKIHLTRARKELSQLRRFVEQKGVKKIPENELIGVR